MAGRASRLCDDSGAEAVEFAMVLPVLLTILFAITTLGTAFYHYQMLIAAAEAGCRYFAASRGISTTPAASTTSYVKGAASGLTAANLTVTFQVNGAACTDATNPTCYTLIFNGIGEQASVQATYPCSIIIFGKNFAPTCQLSQKITEIVE